ncbi:neuropeptide Y receptor type 1-like [Tetranychus urticae]|uniref:neuropeptide Y receptor type 1-like n=1 Tax=Tetranychus urticae TaxID=32264 RepID=UPI00077BF504|nr:neuropeptide Y receptor type 1-like [Tetranychus urticae]
MSVYKLFGTWLYLFPSLLLKVSAIPERIPIELLSTNQMFDNFTFSVNDEINFESYNKTLSLFSEELLYSFPLGVVVLLVLAYGIVSLTAVIGNTIVLCCVVGSVRLRTVTNMFIANLATADILIGALSIPFQFQAALLQKWILPPFMCAFCPFIQIVSVNVSIYTLVAIAADRYLVVFAPLHCRINKYRARMIIIFIWAWSVIAAIPALIALRVRLVPDLESAVDSHDDKWLRSLVTGNLTIPTRPSCDNIGMSESIWRGYNQFLVVIQYFLPLGIITFAYTRMASKLHGNTSATTTSLQRTKSGSNNRLQFTNRAASLTASEGQEKSGSSGLISLDNNKSSHQGDSVFRNSQLVTSYHLTTADAEYIVTHKRKVMKMLIVVVALFALCWLPLQTYNLLKDTIPEINTFRYINVIWFCCHWLAMSNSSVNPFIYAIYKISSDSSRQE